MFLFVWLLLAYFFFLRKKIFLFPIALIDRNT